MTRVYNYPGDVPHHIYVCCVVLCCAVLCCDVLCCVVLCCVVLCCFVATGKRAAVRQAAEQQSRRGSLCGTFVRAAHLFAHEAFLQKKEKEGAHKEEKREKAVHRGCSSPQ